MNNSMFEKYFKSKSILLNILLVLCLVSIIATMIFICYSKIPVKTVEGRFYHGMELTDCNGVTDTYYQFRSDDNSVWWLLTADEIGEIPDIETKYSLKYNNNFTTECNCSKECECYCYDDELINIRRLV